MVKKSPAVNDLSVRGPPKAAPSLLIPILGNNYPTATAPATLNSEGVASTADGPAPVQAVPAESPTVSTNACTGPASTPSASNPVSSTGNAGIPPAGTLVSHPPVTDPLVTMTSATPARSRVEDYIKEGRRNPLCTFRGASVATGGHWIGTSSNHTLFVCNGPDFPPTPALFFTYGTIASGNRQASDAGFDYNKAYPPDSELVDYIPSLDSDMNPISGTIPRLAAQLPYLSSIGVHNPLAVRNLLRAASVHSTLTSLSVTVSTREHVLAINRFFNLRTLDVTFSRSPTSYKPDVASVHDIACGFLIQGTVGFTLAELQTCTLDILGVWASWDPLPESIDALQVIGTSRLPSLRRLSLSPAFSNLTTDDPCPLATFGVACSQLKVMHVHGCSVLAFDALERRIPQLDLLSIKYGLASSPQLPQYLVTSNILPASLSMECAFITPDNIKLVLSFLHAIGRSHSGLQRGFTFIIWEHLGSEFDEPDITQEDESSKIDTRMTLFFDLDPQFMWRTLPPPFWARLVRALQLCRRRLGVRGVEMSWRLQTKDDITMPFTFCITRQLRSHV